MATGWRVEDKDSLGLIQVLLRSYPLRYASGTMSRSGAAPERTPGTMVRYFTGTISRGPGKFTRGGQVPDPAAGMISRFGDDIPLRGRCPVRTGMLSDFGVRSGLGNGG